MHIAFDLETTGLNPRKDKIISYALAYENGQTAYALWNSESAEKLKKILENPTNIIVGHNIKFDWQFVEKAFGKMRGVHLKDTLLLAWLINENEEGFSLGVLAKNKLGIKLKSFKEYGVQGNLFEQAVGIEEKCIQDVDATIKLYKTLRPQLDANPSLAKVYDNLYCPLIYTIVEMESEGILLDRNRLMELKEKFRKEKDLYAGFIRRHGGTPSRNEMLSKLLFGEHGLKPKSFMVESPHLWRTKKGNWKISKDVLCEYDDDHLVKSILCYRDADKKENTYALPWLEESKETGKIHTHFFQARSPKFAGDEEGGTATGRWASGDPINLQTLPRKGGLKSAIIAEPNHVLIYADYGQLELRIMAHASQDKELLRAYSEGLDLHQMTMDALNIPDRRLAKNCNFGLLYKIGPRKFARQLKAGAGITISESYARELIDKWYKKYEGVAAYQLKIEKFVKLHGYVETILKRRRRLEEDLRFNPDGAVRMAINATIQGSAADIVGMAILDMEKVRKPTTRTLLQVHDSITLMSTFPEEKDVLKRCMECAIKLRVPLVANVGIGTNLELAEENAH